MTIIIPTLDAGARIGRLLTALKSQTLKSRILVVDSSVSADSSDLATSLGAEVMRIQRREFDHGRTRNMALERAEGEHVVYLTDDVLPCDERAIEHLLRPFSEDDSIGAAYGRQLPSEGATLFGAHLRSFNYPEKASVKSMTDAQKSIKTPFLSNSFAAYRRDALMRIGGFRKRLIMGEDVCAGALLLREGFKLAYAADARVYHSHNYSVFEEFRRYFDIGVFHRTEHWILEEFGQAEGEGMRFIRSELALILREGKYHLIPEFLLRNLMKYTGYRLGKKYTAIPGSVVRKMSMHRDWWDKK